MKIEVNISKKYFLIIIAVIVIAAAVVGVIAYGTNDPPTFGHSFEELEIDYTQAQKRVTGDCTSGNAIRRINQGGGVTCQSVGYGGQVVIDAYWTWKWNSPPSCPDGFTQRNTGVSVHGNGDLYFVFCLKYAN